MSDNASTMYNPLDKRSIADSIVRELLEHSCRPLPPANRFNGAGIYVIYYRGSLAVYQSLSERNQQDWQEPIYVGKAIPAGGRMGVNVDESARGQALYNRLSEHADSIRAASSTLRLDDFSSRYLVVDELFIDLAERTLIQRYKPVWNACIGGFGNHDPGGGRYNQKRSGWDELHPGRTWAAKCQPSQFGADIWRDKVRQYLGDVFAGAVSDLTVVDDSSGTPPDGDP